MIIMKIDGQLVSVNNGREAIAICFASMQDLNHWSHDALKKLYRGIFDLFYANENNENLKSREKAALTRFRKYCLQKKKFMPVKDRDRLLAAIFELILSNEGKGRLRCFGFGNQFGDRLKGNAETDRLSKERI